MLNISVTFAGAEICAVASMQVGSAESLVYTPTGHTHTDTHSRTHQPMVCVRECSVTKDAWLFFSVIKDALL